MSPDLTPRERAALAAAARDGLTRGRSGFYPGFSPSNIRPHLPATIRALEKRGFIARPDALSPRRVVTEAGRALIATPQPLPPAAPPRAYKD